MSTPILTEGFETLPSWASAGTLVAGRTGGNALQLVGAATATYAIPIGQQAITTYLDVWWKTSAPTSTTSFLQLQSPAGTGSVTLRTNAFGTIDARLGGAGGLMISQSATLTSNTWYHIEVKLVVGDTGSGVIEVKLDGTVFASTTVDDTKPGSSNVAEALVLLGNATSGSHTFDDLVLSTDPVPTDVRNARQSARVLVFPQISVRDARQQLRALISPEISVRDARQAMRVMVGPVPASGATSITFTATASPVATSFAGGSSTVSFTATGTGAKEEGGGGPGWRPFVLRRTIGGDVTRAITEWQGALRFGPKDFPFDAVVGTTLTGIPIGYDSTLLTVSVPPGIPWQEMVLVRGGFGYPNTPLDGEAVWYYSGHNRDDPDQYNQQVRDEPLTEGRWYYYTLFLCLSESSDIPCEWMVGAVATILVPKNYHHAEKLFEMIPPFYQRTDDQQAADGRHGPLRKFAAIIGYDCDYDRTLLDGVLDVYHPDFAPLMFMQQVGANLGFPAESALGGARYRSIIGQLWDLESTRGTSQGFQDFVYAASNYHCVVVTGVNSLLSPDDAEFVNGSGHWQSYTNPHVTDMENGVNHTHPPADPYTYLAVRKYTGTDLTPPVGQGILEIIEAVDGGTPDSPGTDSIDGGTPASSGIGTLDGGAP